MKRSTLNQTIKLLETLKDKPEPWIRKYGICYLNVAKVDLENKQSKMQEVLNFMEQETSVDKDKLFNKKFDGLLKINK